MAKKKGKKSLGIEKKSGWLLMKKRERKRALRFADEYRSFLERCKTERETVEFIVSEAERNGFRPLDEVRSLSAGDRVYMVDRNKAVMLAVIGRKPVSGGMRFVVSHIDTPRLDLKLNPLTEDSDASLALLKTHYYGGIKKYQWASIPLALHGVVYTRDGKRVEVRVGESPDDPVFMVPDLLPHLARKVQGDRKLFEGIKGEELQLVVGNIPVEDEDVKARVKEQVLRYLNDKYGITEEDFHSADLEAVPAYPPRDVGFDASMIGAYGHDDRVCAYTSMRSLMDVDVPEYTAVAVFFDREEIGSDGNTGAKSSMLEYAVLNLLEKTGEDGTYANVLRALRRSRALSADVSAAVNPLFKGVHDLQNAPVLGYGISILKYTGAGGKYSSNEAHAEFLSEIRRLFSEHGIAYQMVMLGKVDEGGGGTIAKFMAEYGMDVVDAGVPVLSMHSPFEVVSKADVWYAYRAFREFFVS